MHKGVVAALAAVALWAGVRSGLALDETAGVVEPTSFPAFAGLPERPARKPLQPMAESSHTIAIVGDLAPANDATPKYLKQAVDQLNLLRPDAVFCVGNLVPGYTRSGMRYANASIAVCGALDRLNMPWHPCAGASDVISGTRDVRDRRFEGLYEKYFGPLYYSVDSGNVHVIVLDSEEGLGKGNALSDKQLAWLKADLNKTFEAHVPKATFGLKPVAAPPENKAQYVIVLVHRPLWRIESKEFPSNWDQVHEMLVDFNRRPIVSVEGMNGGASEARGPRVVGVYAGGTRAYSEEPTRDGIHYVVLGATAARLDQDAAVEVRHFTLLKFDSPPPPAAEGLGVHPVVIEMGGTGPGGQAAGTVVGADVITLRERAVLDRIAAIPNEALGIIGAVVQPVPGMKIEEGKETGLRLVLGNPLEVPIDVEIRMASARNLSTATLRENANPYVESFDSPWQLRSPYLGRHLEPKTAERYRVALAPDPLATQFPPPQVEFVVHWTDPRGRVHDVILKRKVTLVPQAKVPLAEMVSLNGVGGWDRAASGTTHAWRVRGDEPQKRSPEWEMVADRERLYVRVRVEDGVKSYWASRDAGGSGWGGLPSDAVFVGFGGNHLPARRLWVLAAEGKENVWINGGFGEKQTPLAAAPGGWGVRTRIEQENGGYVVTLAIPRKLVFGEGDACTMNIGVHDNDDGAWTWVRSWASDVGDGVNWGRVTIGGEVAGTQAASTREDATEGVKGR
jgi:hypothetical protein